MLFFWGLGWLYFAGMESSERQATFGKSVVSLRVTDLEGRRLSFKHATGRFFAKIVSGLIPLAIGYIMAGFTEKKQALHDMIAGTLVLQRTPVPWECVGPLINLVPRRSALKFLATRDTI